MCACVCVEGGGGGGGGAANTPQWVVSRTQKTYLPARFAVALLKNAFTFFVVVALLCM